MTVDSELLRRLSRIPADRRTSFLTGLRAATAPPAPPPDDIETLMREWAPDEVPRSPRTITEVFTETAARHPGRVAVVDSAGRRTYAELATEVEQLAAALRARGVDAEHPVAVLTGRGDARAVIGILAVLRAGGYWVPIDPGNPAERIAGVLRDADPILVLADAGTEPVLPPDGPPVFRLDRPWPAAPPLAASPGHPHRLAYAIYTSGSTGVPKAVQLGHAGAVHFIETVQRMFRLTPEDRLIQYASLGFDVSVFEIFAALLTGAALYLPGDDERLSVTALSAALRRERITVVDLPPAILNLLDPAGFPDLRVAFVGGEAFTGELTTRWARHCRFVNGYGPTECTVTVVAKECTGEWTTSPPIGRAMDNHVAYALDERLRPVPVGEPGELCIGGPGLARGYAGRPGLTADRFVPDPWARHPGDRLYRTGDLCRWTADGDLVFLGRNDRQVQVHGHRVELGDVESALVRADGVRQAVATTEDGGQLVAYIVPVTAPADLAAIRARAAELVPRHMVPALLIEVDAIPLTVNGKTDLAALRRIRPVGGDDGAAELTPAQRRLRDACLVPVLGTVAAGPDDDFFELGGDSIQAIRLLSRVREEFGAEIPLSDFLREPTLAWLAGTVETAATAGPGSDLDAILAGLAELSDDEVEAMLAE
ncbi:non-ribosomal peptide synthetase [Plantactinospora sp. ZYX-F-223]|uniref:non-ribosomal peptide synthetase n=1 Tax=Plantactinospora sp. ZYX-F-223 TaxID=3144103 RepID=UPI0031FD91BF